MSDLAIEKSRSQAQPAPTRSGDRGPRIGLQSVGYTVRTLDVLFLVVTGLIAYGTNGPGDGPESLAAAYAALAILVLMVGSLPGTGINLEHFLRRRLIDRLLTAGFQTALPFVLTIGLTLGVHSPASPLLEWLATWAGLLIGTIAVERVVLHGLLRRWRAKGTTKQVVAVVGSGELANKLVRWLESSCPDSIEIIGVFDDRSGNDPGRSRLRHLLRGTTDQLIELSRNQDIDRIIVALPHAAERRLLTLFQKLKQIPVPISLAPDEVGFATLTENNSELGGLPIINVYGRPLEFSQLIAKSLLDRGFALAALIMLSPVLIAAAIAIKLDSKGPVLFRQDRFGYGNRVIKVYKFRTMRTDLLDFGGAKQTQRGDPRITRVGNFLRKSSIDELPQLWNVLRGEMSIVGPRPMPLQMRVQDKLNHEIVSEYAHRHRVKPGLTGWAQVNGYRGAVETPEDLRARVAYDLQYIDNWSLWLDIKIILRTVTVCVGHQNAY